MSGKCGVREVVEYKELLGLSTVREFQTIEFGAVIFEQELPKSSTTCTCKRIAKCHDVILT